MEINISTKIAAQSEAKTYKPNIYSKLPTAFAFFILSFISDFFCFTQLLPANGINIADYPFWTQGFWGICGENAPILVGLMLAFDAAPMYIGYLLCIKSVRKEYGSKLTNEKLTNAAMVFSSAAFFIGIIINFLLRIRHWQVAVTVNDSALMSDMAQNNLKVIAMCLIPLVTSLMSLTVGCLSFDPLLLDFKRISKKLSKLYEQKLKLEEYIRQYEDENGYKTIPDITVTSAKSDAPKMELLDQWSEMMKQELQLCVEEAKKKDAKKKTA